jgi:uncharacterized membrane protein
MLVPFPIAFFVGAFVCDLAFARSGDAFWFTAALWLIGAGLVGAALAAAFGMIDVASEPRIRALNDVWWHAGGNVIAVVIQLFNWYLRYTSGEAAILPTGLALSFLVICILLFTGWKGWELVYRHRVGVADQ